MSPSGQRYLVWKGAGARGVATLFAQKLSADGLSLMAPGRVQLLQSVGIAWAGTNIEGPGMLYSGGRYYLFYSDNDYRSTHYGIGYAVCSGPLCPCTNRSTGGPWVGAHGQARGPGGEGFFTDPSDSRFMAYHAWGTKVGYQNGGVRSLWIDRLNVHQRRPHPGMTRGGSAASVMTAGGGRCSPGGPFFDAAPVRRTIGRWPFRVRPTRSLFVSRSPPTRRRSGA